MCLLALFSVPLADVRVLARQDRHGTTIAPARGHLTVPLDSWGTVAFTFKGQTVEMTTGEIFAILKGK